MASKNQTPAPKVSPNTNDKNNGQRKELAVELDSGLENGISPQNIDEGQLSAKTTLEQQEEQNERSRNDKSLGIPYGTDADGKTPGK